MINLLDIKERVLAEKEEDYIEKINNQDDFIKKQKRVVLENCEIIDPENIEEYIARSGYFALEKALKEMTRDQIVDSLIEANLRGRGGAGFPTGMKWKFTKDANSKKKYVVCNADEGDPGAFMDRYILEHDPHSVVESMIIAGYAIGADEAYVYIRAEYPKASQRLEKAIDDAKAYGLLGEKILGTNFNFDIKIRLGAGAFVCGEETALLESIEGKRGIPRNKPPYPAQYGLYNKPTLINNVETFANVSKIILRGPKWFKSFGSKSSPGTKVFSLVGNIENTGLIEVPMGTSFREIVYDIGGGIPNGKSLKAVQTGGPSGGVIPSDLVDVKIDFDSLKEHGAMMGSGGLIVMDEDTCMIDIVKFYLEFIIDESCGKCTPCRIGNKRLYELLDKISMGKATERDLIDIKNLADVIKSTSACGLGQSSPNPTLSTLTYFLEEYFEHILDRHCRAGVCKGLIEYEITKACIGCTKCSRVCPVQCIGGTLKHRHFIDNDACIKCGSCLEACPVGAVIVK